MTEDRLPKAALNYKAIDRRDVGRSRIRWLSEQVYILEEKKILQTNYIFWIDKVSNIIHCFNRNEIYVFNISVNSVIQKRSH